MSQNLQVPYFYTLVGDDGNILTITGARSITCYTTVAITNIVNSDGQSLQLPIGVAFEMDADTGNTFTEVVITPEPTAIAYVSMLGGNAVIS